MTENFKTILLTVPKIQLKTHLGVYENELSFPQFVYVSLEFKFTNNNAIFTDDFQDSICYESLSIYLIDFFTHEKTKTIEKLTYKIFTQIQQFYLSLHKKIEKKDRQNIVLINVMVEKKVVVNNIFAPVSFSLKEF